jgi:hypothetical protein
MSEQVFGAIVAMMLSWGGFTWKRSEEALTQSRQATDKIDSLELKMAEHYLSKKEFESYMNRLFGTLGEMKDGMHYLTERVDYHVSEQASEAKNLRAELSRLRQNTHQRRIDD